MGDRSSGSLCSSVGGLDAGLHRAGWGVRWFCEKIEWRRRVLARHWPGVHAHDDLLALDPADLCAVRLLAGGTPCTDLSLAGRRAGLDGDASRLFWDFVRIRNALEPEWTLWENVEGALSSNEGLDFACVLGAFVGADVAVPSGGWARAGVVAGPWGGAVWRLLDAQYFGVPQRRRRVFVVGRLGGPCPPEVLLESAGGGGDPPPRGEARARVAAPLTRGSSRPGVSEPERRLEDDANLVSPALTGGDGVSRSYRIGMEEIGQLQVVGGLDSQAGGPDENDAAVGLLVAEESIAGTLTSRYAKGANRTADEGALVPGVAATLNGKRGAGGGGLDPEETLLAHALTSEGFDASEDGTGRGTPRVAEGSVRRLTPTECERLMGWPDGWTLDTGPSLLGTPTDVASVRSASGESSRSYAVPADGEAANRCAVDPLPDGRRYAACGDGVVANVSHWIGARTLAVDEGRDPDEAGRLALDGYRR